MVRTATGKCTETMIRESWDAQEFVGQEGFVRLVDSSSDSWGHINFDQTCVETLTATFASEASYAGQEYLLKLVDLNIV